MDSIKRKKTTFKPYFSTLIFDPRFLARYCIIHLKLYKPRHNNRLEGTASQIFDLGFSSDFITKHGKIELCFLTQLSTFHNTKSKIYIKNQKVEKVIFESSDPSANIFFHPHIYGLYCMISLLCSSAIQ